METWEKTWKFMCDLRPRGGKRWRLTLLTIDMNQGSVTEKWEEVPNPAVAEASDNAKAYPTIVYKMTD